MNKVSDVVGFSIGVLLAIMIMVISWLGYLAITIGVPVLIIALIIKWVFW